MLWLIVTNIALAVFTLIGCAAVAIGIRQEIGIRRRKRAELANLDAELAELLNSHTFHTPGLGITMADGGEELHTKGKEER